MPVPYEGPLDAKIYIVGEAPGEREVQLNRPFVGSSGLILDRLLLDAGIDRARCRVGNLSRVRPVGNDFSQLPEELVKTEVENLCKDISECNPNVILALGKYPLLHLTNLTPISAWRGSVVQSENSHLIRKFKVVPTYHPAAILRQWDYSPLALFDIKKARKESEELEVHYQSRNHQVLDSASMAVWWLRNSFNHKDFAFDIETTRGDVWMTSIALSSSPNHAVVIPFQKGTVPVWSEQDEKEIMLALKQCLENPSTKKIAQNAQFDIGVLSYRYGIKVANLAFDTRAAFHCLMPELPKDLATLCSLFTDQPYYKNTAHDGWDAFLRYNALDAMVTFEVYKALEKELREFGTLDFYLRYVHPRLQVLSDMEIRGIKVDRELLKKVDLMLQLEEELAGEQLDNLVGYRINPLSPTQLKTLLYDEMRIKPRIKDGKPTTDEEALTSIAAAHPSPIFDLILKIRGSRKLRSTYINAALGEDGRMHTSFSTGSRVSKSGREVSAPETGRLSSSLSIITNSGTNLQNVPKGPCRQVFIPDEEYILVECDLSQAEARVVAWRAQDTRMMEVFISGKDIHRFLGSIIFSVPYDQLTKGSPERVFAKTHVHAFNYMESVAAFAARAKIPKSKAGEIQARYFQEFPAIKAWHNEVEKTLRATRTITTAMGRKRNFFGRWNDALVRSAVAYEPQSIVGDIASEAMCRLDALGKKGGLAMGLQVLLQVHDSVLFQVSRWRWGNVWKEILDEVFHIPVTIKGKELVIPYECKSGMNWNEMKGEW